MSSLSFVITYTCVRAANARNIDYTTMSQEGGGLALQLFTHTHTHTRARARAYTTYTKRHAPGREVFSRVPLALGAHRTCLLVVVVVSSSSSSSRVLTHGRKKTHTCTHSHARVLLLLLFQEVRVHRTLSQERCAYSVMCTKKTLTIQTRYNNNIYRRGSTSRLLYILVQLSVSLCYVLSYGKERERERKRYALYYTRILILYYAEL